MALLNSIDSFDFQPGRVLGGKYEVEALLGGGIEGEVYKVNEVRTGLPRAAKIFFPQANPADKVATRYARTLEKLRQCPVVIHYHHAETLTVRRLPVTCLISEYVDGELLCDFIEASRGKRLQPFEALSVLYPIVKGVEEIHRQGEYHGDLHSANIMIKRRGIFHDVKIVDFYDREGSSAAEKRADILDLVRLLYDMVGGRRTYARQPQEIKAICCGLRHDLVLGKFPTTRHLREHLESFSWG